MSLDPRLVALRDRAARALGNHRIEQAVAKYRAVIGPASIPSSEPAAQSAFDKLHLGEIPTPEELAALEIVVRLMRPVVFSRNGVLDDLPDQEEHNLYPEDLKDAWSAFKTKIAGKVPSVGRIETTAGRHIGTGFLVAEILLATNRHVLGALTFGSEVIVAGSARVVFRYETDQNNQPTDFAAIEEVAAIHSTLDMVLLRIGKTTRPALDIDAKVAGVGERIAIIGYPGEDAVNNPLFLKSVFQDRFGLRRAALGEVLDGTETPAMFHDGSTTQGNSGSPVFSLVTGLIVGIHRSGFFMYRNEAIDANPLGAFVEQALRGLLP